MASQIITVFNQKGGSGKTTMSVHASVGLAQRGYKVMLVDADAQGTAMRWAKQAPDDSPFPASVSKLADMGNTVHRELKKHRDDYDFIVVDCPPSIESGAASSAMLVSNLALIPVVPAPADMWAAAAAKELALAAKALNEDLVIRTVPNMVQKQTTLAREALEVLAEDEEIPCTAARLASRSAYRECQLEGATVHSLSKAREAIQETEELISEVLDLLNMPQQKEA